MATANNALLLMLVAASGFFDLKERKIPNKITFTGILIGLIFNLITGGWLGLFQGVVGMFVGLAIFFLPFVMGGMGAGDVKLMGAIGALMGWKFSVMTALYSAIVGGVMVVIHLAYTGKLRETLKKMLYALINLLLQFFIRLGYSETVYKAHEKFSKNGQDYKKIYIPYGVAIAGGAVLVLIAYKQGFPIF
ncbi:prepilin peptidase [uncultured Trichococcus sp.]|uniref:A24 family peptidase n=1 Tax=uncultured Trichococcus sp. TaxID=189665 RepID=UPI002A1884E4|nr:prepilin peptidase [uncultured Trichococcus sp.]